MIAAQGLFGVFKAAKQRWIIAQQSRIFTACTR
jgi:hypothetical protein